MRVPDRVHIVPLGYERDRVVRPTLQLKADRVILLHHDEPSDERPPYHAEIRDCFEEEQVTYEECSCDIFDLYGSLGEIARIITRYGDDDVYVNLATGSKVTAIGGMIACMATGATPYYVRAKRYGPEGEHPPKTPVSFGVAGIDELPAYPIEGPSVQQVAILNHLKKEEYASKKELIEFSERMELPFLADYDSDVIKGKYRLLDAHVLDALVEDGYVEIEEVGRDKRAHLTPDGAKTLQAFSYLLN